MQKAEQNKTLKKKLFVSFIKIPWYIRDISIADKSNMSLRLLSKTSMGRVNMTEELVK